MREKIFFLAKGQFTYEPPELVIEPSHLKTDIVSGTKMTLTITVSNARETKLKGFGFVEAQELTFMPLFEGEKNVLECEIDASELIAGTKLRGKLILVTDCGEAQVPYDIHVVAPVLTDEAGNQVRDYFTLEKIAATSPKEGLQLFRDPVFRETFLYRDPEGQLIYDRLSKGNAGLSGMEEFLVAFEKKEPVRFVPEHAGTPYGERIEYELSGSDIDDVIMVNLTSWGSIAIRVEVVGNFIEVDRTILWTDEFADMRGRLDFRIIAGRVRPGNHYGRIIFTSPYERHVVEIYVMSPVGTKERKVGRAKQAVEAMLVRSFLAYEEGRVTKDEFRSFLQKHRSVLEKLDLRYQKPLMGYMAYLLGSEAGKLGFYRDTENLERPKLGDESVAVDNYVLIEYIKYMYSGRDEDLERLARVVSTYAESGYMGTTLLLVGVRCDREQYGADAKCVERIRELLAKGGNSPVLYSELIRRFRSRPDLLNELDALNLRTLLYGLRQELITKELADVVTVLAEGRGLPPIDSGQGFGYTRETDPLRRGTGALLMRVLFGIYERYPSSDTLRAICTLLIRYEKRDRRYFPWYERGVNEMMRLTDLFEYYMYTVDPAMEDPLPPVILSYFQYENHLNDTRKAFLYANIVKNKDKAESAFDTYQEQIHEFVLQQIGRERVTTDLGYLYNEMLTPEDVVSLREHLPHILFRHLLICETPGIESVTIVHLQTTVERTYPLDRGKALLDIYTPDYRLFFSDKDGNQFVESIDYKLERFFDGDRFAYASYPDVPVEYAGVKEKPKKEKKPEEEPIKPEPEPERPKVMTGADRVAAAIRAGAVTRGEELPEPEEGDELVLIPLDVSDNLLFHLAVQAERRPRLGDAEMDVLFRALACGKLRDSFHGKVFLRLYDHIRDRVPEEDRDGYMRFLIRHLRPDTIRGKRIGEVATDCVRCGAYDEALSMLRRFGRSGCGEDEMAKLVIDRIRRTDYEFDDCLVKWALMLYRKEHHDHVILNYLLQYYMGETDTLIEIFHHAVRRTVDGTGAAQMESFEGHIKTNPDFFESVRERLLGQVIFSCKETTATEDVFLKYYEDGDNRVLVKAYLSEMAYEYLVGKIDLSDSIFEKIYRQARYEHEDVMVLAALKKLVGKGVYPEVEQEFIERSLDDLAAGGCILPFMKDFKGTVTVPYEIRTPIIVQYFSATKANVFLFCKNRFGEYESYPMNRVFDGIFTVNLLLFAGEVTTGYIYEEETGKRSKNFELKKKETYAGGDSLFEQVNAMLEAKKDGDDDKVQRLGRKFEEEKQVAKVLFKLL